MTDVQEFCLRWNNHQSNLVSAFHDLRQGKDFVDVTLACDGCSLLAHRVVLSACSPFFRDLLKTTPCKHPVIVLKDISFRDLVALVEFMYQGEVRVDHDGLPSFLRTAEVLRVRGLTEDFVLRQKAAPAPYDTPSTSHAQPKSAPPPASAAFLPKHEHCVSPRPVPRGINVANWASSIAEVKMEEAEVNSSSPDVSDAEREQDTVPLDEDKSEDPEPAHPSLTLQSFARIPPLIPQDFGKDLAPDYASSLANEERRPAIDIPPSAIDQDMGGGGGGGGGGRPPGRSSTSDRPRWPCPFCMRLLSSRSSVRRHIEDKHTDDTSRHPCPLCERLYRTRNSLQYHLSTAHRDREPGPRGRPRTRSRASLAVDTLLPENEIVDGENPRSLINLNQNLLPLTRGASFGLPPT